MDKNFTIKKIKINSTINVILYLFFIVISLYDYYTTRKFMIPTIYITLFSLLLIAEVRAIINKTYSPRLFLSRR